MNNENELLYSKWDDILLYMYNSSNIAEVAYNTFIKALKFKECNGDVITIVINMSKAGANTDETKKYIITHYSDLLSIAISVKLETDKQYKLNFVFDDANTGNAAYYPVSQSNEANGSLPESQLSSDSQSYENNLSGNLSNLNYTFENFIAGEENQMVYAVCVGVAENPGENLTNPLFIYGNSGLGKTHLMHAIANRIRQNDSSKNVCYVTSETFTNEIIEAIRKNKGDNTSTKEFRSKYRNVDVLLIDDIQSMIGREAVQSEFFNTFNELIDQQHQVVLSSDKPPKDLKILEERMSSRFLSGYTVDVKIPTYETRMAILRQKLQDENVDGIDNEVLDFIANNVSSNIRELQGAMKRVIINYKIKGSSLTIEEIKNSIADMITTGKTKNITIDTIIAVVCEQFGVSKEDILGDSRKKPIVEPRQMIMYLGSKHTGNTYEKIGAMLGGMNHSTVMHGEKSTAQKLADPNNNTDLIYNYNEIIKKLGIQNK